MLRAIDHARSEHCLLLTGLQLLGSWWRRLACPSLCSGSLTRLVVDTRCLCVACLWLSKLVSGAVMPSSLLQMVALPMLASHSYRPQSMEWIWDWCSTARFCSSWWTCSFGLLSDASCSLLISCFGFLMLDYCDLDHQSPQKSAHQAVLGHHSSLSARFLCSLSCLFSCLRLCSPCRRSFVHWSSTVSSGLVVLS